MSLWGSAAALIVSVFGMGIAAGQTTFVRELWSGKAEVRPPVPKIPIRATPAIVSVVAKAVDIPLLDSYDGAQAELPVEVDVIVKRGEISLTRQVKLLRVGLNEQFYGPPRERSAMMTYAEPSKLLAKAGETVPVTLYLKWQDLLPPEHALSLGHLARENAGTITAQIIYEDGQRTRTANVDIPMFLLRVRAPAP